MSDKAKRYTNEEVSKMTHAQKMAAWYEEVYGDDIKLDGFIVDEKLMKDE